MNERMRELSEQASKWVCENEPRAFDDTDLFYELMQAKFAELIVGECAEVSKNYAGGSMPLSIALAIKKHFGVE